MTTPSGRPRGRGDAGNREVRVDVVGEVDDDLRRDLDRLNNTVEDTENSARRATREQDDLADAFDRTDREAERLQRELQDIDNELEDLRQETERTERGFDGLGRRMRNVGGPTGRVLLGFLSAAAGGVAALTAGFASANSRFEETRRLSQETGIEFEALQRFQAGAAAAGLDVELAFDGAAQGLREYNLRLGEFRALGSGQFTELQDLGIDPEQFAEASSEAERYIGILEGIRDVNQQQGEQTAAVVADLLLGGLEGELAVSLATSSSQRFNAYVQGVRNASVTSAESQQRFQESTAALSLLNQEFGVLLQEGTAPLGAELARVAEQARPLIADLTEWASESEGLEAVAAAVGQVFDVLIDFINSEADIQRLDTALQTLAATIELVANVVEGLAVAVEVFELARRPSSFVEGPRRERAAIQASQDQAVAEAVARAERETAERAAAAAEAQIVVSIDSTQVAAATERRVVRDLGRLQP